jgi:hypothetical protein
MPHADTRSLQQIKRETEQTRAGLTDTVEQLKTSVAETAVTSAIVSARTISRRRFPATSRAGASSY